MIVPAACDRRPDTPSVSLWYIARRLGREDSGEQTLLGVVRRLHASEHFPPPLPDFTRDGRRVQAPNGSPIVARSRWDRRAVDAWFDGLLPPQLAAVPDDGAIAAAHAGALDQAAAELAGMAA